MKKERREQREKNEESNTNINTNIKTFPIKIKILLEYLEKILYLGAVGECGGKEKKLALGKRRAQDTNTAEYRRKNRTPLLDDIQPNERCYNRLIVGANEESLVALVDDSGLVKAESRLVVNGNPPEFFDLMTEVLTVEEIDHPPHAHKTALQKKELTPLFVVQFHNIKRGSCGGVISESDG